MARFAGHLPTKHFDQAEWSAMPVWVPKYDYEYRPDGFFRMRTPNGKPIVVYGAPYYLDGADGEPLIKSGEVDYAVRPVVRVKMGRREVGTVENVVRAQPRCGLCGSRGMERYCGRSRCPALAVRRDDWRSY